MKKRIFAEERFPSGEALSLRTTDSLRAMGRVVRTLKERAEQRGLRQAGPLFTVYHGEPKDPERVDYEMFLPVSGPNEAMDVLEEFGGEDCLKLRHRGSYASLGEAYSALAAECARRGLAAAGPPREIYVRGPLLGLLFFIPTMVTDVYFPVSKD